MSNEETGAAIRSAGGGEHLLRHAGIDHTLAELERRIAAIERVLATLPLLPEILPLPEVVSGLLGGGAAGPLLATTENINLTHCQWHTIYDGETPKRVKITGGNGGPGKVEIEVDGKRIDDLRTPDTTFVEGKKIRVHFKQDEPRPDEPEPLLGGFTGITVERGVGPGALMGTIHLELRPCEWHTVFSISAKACVRIVNSGGINPEPLEIEVDGARKDDLGVGNSGQYEGKTIRVHAKGAETALVSVEPCR